MMDDAMSAPWPRGRGKGGRDGSRPLTLVDRSIADVTDSSRLDHVANGESLDGLVLGDRAGAVGASHKRDVSTAVLVASSVSSLFRLPCPETGTSAMSSSRSPTTVPSSRDPRPSCTGARKSSR
jgi:hypothetical protein